MDKLEAKTLSVAHINKYVRITMLDGAVFDGLIEKVDDEHVYIASPVREDQDARHLGFPGFGFPGVGFPGVGFPGVGFPGVGFPGFGLGVPPFGFGLGFPFGFGFGLGFPGFVRRFGLPLGGIFGLGPFPFGFI